EFGISYESDLDLAMRILQEEAESHPSCLDHRTEEDLATGEPKVAVRLIQIADSSLVLRAYAWASDPLTARTMHFDLNRSVKLRFDREGIEIPYPHRTITYKGPGPAPAA
ncbi:MAG: mechanosensitive ion channel, partial [Flavobacteriales bacterium]|nr:mechanosensitive ion channel [Flavobacteriales bacterium]